MAATAVAAAAPSASAGGSSKPGCLLMLRSPAVIGGVVAVGLMFTPMVVLVVPAAVLALVVFALRGGALAGSSADEEDDDGDDAGTQQDGSAQPQPDKVKMPEDAADTAVANGHAAEVGQGGIGARGVAHRCILATPIAASRQEFVPNAHALQPVGDHTIWHARGGSATDRDGRRPAAIAGVSHRGARMC